MMNLPLLSDGQKQALASAGSPVYNSCPGWAMSPVRLTAPHLFCSRSAPPALENHVRPNWSRRRGNLYRHRLL